MEYAAAEVLARGLIAEHGLVEWHFGWNRRKRALGLCRYRERRIELSHHFVRENELGPVRETILHEIAHALAGQRAGHGAAWKAVCLRVGCMPHACDKTGAVMPRGRWRATCGGCGKEYHRHRRPPASARYWCRKCGPERGAIRFFLALGNAGG
jgi:predicted SprT family Zn-dependent metalloprotease